MSPICMIDNVHHLLPSSATVGKPCSKMRHRCRRAALYHPQTVDEDTLFFYLESLAARNVLYPSYPLFLFMLPRLARHLKLHFPPQSTKFCNQAIGCTLVELDTGTFIPLSVLRTRFDTDVLATVQRELSAIPEAFQVSFTAQAREDGSRFLFAVEFASADIHATGLQARLLRHPLVQSRFPPMSEGADLGIYANATVQVSVN
jgi:hypothetical protein